MELAERKQLQRVQYPEIPQQHLEQDVLPIDESNEFPAEQVANRQKLRRTFQMV